MRSFLNDQHLESWLILLPGGRRPSILWVFQTGQLALHSV